MSTLFWKKFKALCEAKGTSPNAVLTGMGASSASITYWANGGSPRNSTVKKIAEAMEVPVDYFYNNLYPSGDKVVVKRFPFGEQQEAMVFVEKSGEAAPESPLADDEAINELLSDPDRVALLKATAKLTKQDIEFVSRIIENLQSGE